jgi:two-component system chemotaxis sensor kinase CheA
MNSFTKDDFDQLLAVFREQSLQILDEMGQELLRLEESLSDEEAFARLRRGAHTIKGDSACVGLNGITEIAHKIEDIFDLVVRGERSFDEGVVDVVFRSLDAIRNALNAEPIGDVSDRVAEDLVKELSQTEKQKKGGTTAEVNSKAYGGPGFVGAVSGPGVADAVAKRPSYVRIEAAKIDWLLNLAGEMVIAKSVLDEAEGVFMRRGSDNESPEGFVSARGQLNKLIGELQKNALKMRMVPIGHVFKRFNRPMKELAKESGKSVQFVISGGETEIDRGVVDSLYEPVLHLLRNAVDHGLEIEDERIVAGKNATCRIDLRARHEGSQVVIEVVDDGRGIDVDALKLKALECAVVDRRELDEMSDEEVLDLIFLDGISTAREITKISGRGVGAAAAKDAIKQLRGSVGVKSEIGVGTAFTVRLPLTVGIMKALLFRVRGRLLALSLLVTGEIVHTSVRDIVWLNGVEFYRLRDRFIPLVRLEALLGIGSGKVSLSFSAEPVAEKMFIIIVECESCCYGVVADELIGEKELVIKPIADESAQNEALTGAAILGSGEVALILDADAVFRKSVKSERARRK